jgi:hypothetical protein
MVTTEKGLSDVRKSALTAGISLIIMTLAALFSVGFVHESLVQRDASVTLQNIISQNMLFRAGIFGWIIILICDIVVAWSFYVFLKPMNRNLSLLGSWLRLSYATILGIAIMNLIFVLLLSNNTLFTTDQLQNQVMLYLSAFDSIWSIGLIVFGGHLLIVGWVAFKSDTIPTWISILLLIAALGYIVINVCSTFLPQDDGIITILDYLFTVPMIVGELGFGLWLLFRGGKVSAKG